MRSSSPPPDHVIPNPEPPIRPTSAKLILQEIIRKHFPGFTVCPLTSPHRFNTLTVLGKYARVWYRPYLNRANNLAYVMGNLSDHLVYAPGPLVVNKSSSTRLFIRFHDVWTDLKFVPDIPVIDHYDYRTNTAYHGAVDLGDVMVRSINIQHLKEMLKTARFSTDQFVPGQVYHLIYSVVVSTRLKFLGDLQTAYMKEVPDDVFVTQYTQLPCLRDVICRGVGATQAPCPIAFKCCDFVLDSRGRMTLLESWSHSLPSSRMSTLSRASSTASPGQVSVMSSNTLPSNVSINPSNTSSIGHVPSQVSHVTRSSQQSFARALSMIMDEGLYCSLDPARIVLTDSVISSTFVKESLHGLYPVLTSSLTDKSAIPRAMRMLKLISGVSRTVTFPRPKFICRPTEMSMLNRCGFTIRTCNQLNDVAVIPSDGDSTERCRQFARVLSWVSLLPAQTFHSVVSEVAKELPGGVTGGTTGASSSGVSGSLPKSKKKVRVSSSLQMSEV